MFLALRGAPPCRACPASEPGRACPASEPHASPPSHTDHTVIRSYGGLALRHLPRHLPGIGALPSPRQGIPRKKIQGLPPSILLSPQDCLLQSCCHPRIEGNSTRNSTRGNSEKMGHACFQFRTPRGQQPKNGWCLFPVPRHFESISATYAFQHHIPARHRRLRCLALPRHLPGIGAAPR